MKRISRRDFLKASGAVIGATALAGCAQPAPTAVPTAAPKAAAPAATTAPAATAVPAAKPIKGTKLNYAWTKGAVAFDVFEKGVQDWAKATGVEVTMETAAQAEWSAKLATMAETKQGADIIEMYSNDVPVNAPVLMDISDLGDEIGKKVGGWYDGPKSVGVQNGKWVALPVAIWGQYWHWRTDLFKEAGVEKWPETWEDLHQVGKKLKAKGFPVGFVVGHASTDGTAHCLSLLWSYGGKEFETDGKTIALDSPETLKCLEFFKDFYNDACSPDSFSWTEAGNNQAYNSKQVCATNNAVSIYTGLLANDKPLAEITSLGAPLKGPAGAVQMMNSLYIGIPTYSKNVEAAKACLRDCIFDLTFRAAYCKAGMAYALPPFAGLEKDSRAWPDDPKLASAPTMGRTARVAGYAGPFTKIVGQSMNKYLIIDMFAKVAQGTAPKESIKWAVNEMNVLLKG